MSVFGAMHFYWCMSEKKKKKKGKEWCLSVCCISESVEVAENIRN